MREEKHVVVEAKGYGEILRFVYQKDFDIMDLNVAVDKMIKVLRERFPVKADYTIKIFTVYEREESQKLEDIL